KSKEAIKLRIKRFDAQQPLAQQIPIECFEMTYIKDDAMPLRNRPLIQRAGANNFKELIGFISGIGEALKESICNSLHASRLLSSKNCRAPTKNRVGSGSQLTPLLRGLG